MKNILGLDLGTNSIGWAIVKEDEGRLTGIKHAGCRILPMDAAILGDFDKGNSISSTAKRTLLRGAHRLTERHLLRRERLLRVLHLMGFLPAHFDKEIGWDRTNYKTFGKLPTEHEVQLPWQKDEKGKTHFLFQHSFDEMLADFAKAQPALVAKGKSIPYDWTIYYLRKKALTNRISKEELAWILLNFNQKRGYNQLRDEEDETEQTGKQVEFHALKVVRVEATDEKKGKEVWYNVHLENGWIYRRASSVPLDWEHKIKEFIVTTEFDNEGNPKKDREGNIKRSFRALKEGEMDWALVKKRTESEIIEKKETVGCYIYNTLLQSPNQKIIGGLIRTIERRFYKEELDAILSKQMEFIDELRDQNLFEACVKELYPKNEAHRNNLLSRNFSALFIDDILFYQRPLKSKKSLIADCQYESRSYVDKATGEIISQPIKCVAKSNPIFQEFRLWHFLSNLKIYQRKRFIETSSSPNLFSSSNPPSNKFETDVDVTADFLKDEDAFVALFKWLNDRKEIDQKALLKYFKIKPKEIENYRWNYVEDKTYPSNSTRALILAKLTKEEKNYLSTDLEMKIWHLLYSITTKDEIDAALKEPKAGKHNLYQELRTVFSAESIEKMKSIKLQESNYASYSSKAIQKLLPLMRMGEYWNAEAIDPITKQRIDKLIDGEWDKTIKEKLRDKVFHLTDLSHFRNLPLWQACYIVYNRHSETKDITKWEKPADIDVYLKAFKQYSLRNPIVELVVLETLRTVRDIWALEGSIEEIHLELGREMKNPADKRKQITQQNQNNENTNLRIKRLLMEFSNSEFKVENVRPYSPSQQEILRIYEDGILNSVQDIPSEIEAIIKKFKESDVKKQPSKNEMLRYKLWLEQKYRSPYTGEVIPLGKLFTSAYEIEHIIPQSRYFDDSFSNKVICESEVNKLKNNLLGLEFIKKYGTQKVTLTYGKTVEIFSLDAYQKFVDDNYSRTRGKMKKLLMDEIPDAFIERQLNDSRYISKLIKGLLSNIVRAQDENGNYEPEAVSKNLISCTGGITDRLKKDWGMNDVWNDIVSPRFERLNNLTTSQQFGYWDNKDGKRVFQTTMPLEYQKGFNKKRIDHRHHAMDAIIIACATRDHVNYLNNESAKSTNNNKQQLARKLRKFEKIEMEQEQGGKKIREVPKLFFKPWITFTQDAKVALEQIVVSFKKNIRIVNKTSNHYEHFELKDGVSQKVMRMQTKGDSIAIRKPMHEDTVFGRVNLRKIREVKLSVALKQLDSIVDKDLKEKLKSLIKSGLNEKQIKASFEEEKAIWKDTNLKKIKIYYFTNDTATPFVATRKALDDSFDQKKIEKSITDTGIQKILLNYLKHCNNLPAQAFSPDGIEELNRTIKEYNDGKFHQPIFKVRVYEPLGEKFQVGEQGNKASKFVVAAKGTNLFFAVYQEETIEKKTNETKSSRVYETIPLRIAVDREKKGLSPVSERNALGYKLLFFLSPTDLVYLPTEEEIAANTIVEPLDKKRIYKMVSSSGSQCFFVRYNISTPIVDKMEFSSENKMERSLDGWMIKKSCIPLAVDRLGNIKRKKDD